MKLSIETFRQQIYDYYKVHQRSFPWRETTDPYRIWVSEIMLQQTQTHRVEPKFLSFITAVPTVQDLAQLPVAELFKLWQGLGYNRRALNLQRAAQLIMEHHAGIVPTTVEELDALPGIGYATACAIAAFAYNQPVVFIETNIRRVFIHFFFPGQLEVDDRELRPLIEAALDVAQPRHWYYALMDYGAQLVKYTPNPNRRSRHYTKQSKFEGSNRQIRGAILKQLLVGPQGFEQLQDAIQKEPERVEACLIQLESEGFITRSGSLPYFQLKT